MIRHLLLAGKFSLREANYRFYPSKFVPTPFRNIRELGAPFATAVRAAPSISGNAMRDVAAIWDDPKYDIARDVAALQKVAEAALHEGENFIAYEAAQRALKRLDGTQELMGLQLVQLQATALARGGAPLKSQELLKRLVDEGHQDATTLGRLSRTYRDLALLSENRNDRQRFYTKAYQFALRSFKRQPNYYNGGQAAHAALLLGRIETALKLSHEVERLVHEEQKREHNPADDFWQNATLAEVWLIRNDFKKARVCYLEMRRIGSDRLADIGACARVCRMLLAGMGRNPYLMDDCFRLDPVIIFSGHFFDAPNRASDRFPIAHEKNVQAALRARLRKYSAPIGYCSLSWGADLLFAEELLLRPNPALHICLPGDINTSRKISVESPAGCHKNIQPRDWGVRFDKILEKAASVKILPMASGLPSSEDYAYLNDVMIGLALLRARSLDRDILPLVVWNRMNNEERGGTADFVRYWRDKNVKPVIIDTRKLSNSYHED